MPLEALKLSPSGDLVDAVALMSRLGLARRFLLSRLRALAFENLQQFTAKQLASMSYAMARLRVLEKKDLDHLAVPNIMFFVECVLSLLVNGLW